MTGSVFYRLPQVIATLLAAVTAGREEDAEAAALEEKRLVEEAD